MTNRLMPNTINVGWYLFHAGTVYCILNIDSRNGDLSLREQHTDHLTTLSQTEVFVGQDNQATFFAPSLHQLQSEIACHQPLAQAFIDGNGLPQALMDKAHTIIEYVEYVQHRLEAQLFTAQQQGTPMKQTVALKQILHEAHVSIGLTTYYKYVKLYRQHHGNQAQIAASLRRSSYNQLRMSKAQLHFMDTVLEQYYARPNPLSKAQVYRQAESLLKRTEGCWLDPDRNPSPVPPTLVADLLNPTVTLTDIHANPDHATWLGKITLPSKRWFYGYIKHFDLQTPSGQSLLAARYGLPNWDNPTHVYDTFITQAAMPLQYVFADHWQLDVLTLNEANQPVRLWLTLLIDGFSRCVLGMALLPEAPCIESIQQALLHAIWPKRSHQQWGLADDWICYGIPQQLSLDNAWAHHSHSLEDLARSISMDGRYPTMTLAFRPPYRGRYGAIIERLFGTLADQVRMFLPGAIQTGERHVYHNAVKTACLRYDDLNRFLHEIILHYQHTPHDGLKGMTPHQKWQEGLQLGLPLVPQLTPSVERLFWRMEPRSRTITSKGVCLFGMHYTAPVLATAGRVNQRGETIHYTIRYTPTDISRLALFHDGHWVGEVYAKELRLPNGTTQALSLAERELARQWARQMNHPGRDWLQFTHYWQDIATTRQKERQQPRQSHGVPEEVPLVVADYAAHYTDLIQHFTQVRREM